MIERYYNGPQSGLMDELYDRLTEHGDLSEYPDWPSLSLYIAREIQQIEINHLAEIAKKNDELTRIKSKTRCAYCGFEIERDDTAAQKISEHIKACPKHPMRVWEARCEALEEQAKQYKDEIAALTAELQHAQGSYADGVGESRLEEQGLRKEIAALKDENLNLYEASRKTIAKREEQIAQLKIALKKI